MTDPAAVDGFPWPDPKQHIDPEACRRADAALALRRPVQPTDITALTAELRALLA